MARLIAVPVELHFDFDSNAVFVCFYLPSVPDPAVFICDICAQVNRVLAIGEGRKIMSGKEGELPARSEDLVFAGRVFVYAEDDLPDEQLNEVTSTLRTQGCISAFAAPLRACPISRSKGRWPS